ncbi:MAG TPA: N-acetyltransferase [Phaeodactylibacter sp.]|nr:N-acetyltransferase [Phaeodactylibacter sp.]
MGYRLKRNYWGKGIATETAIASLKYGFEEMNLDAIGGAADIKHTASNKILRKVGLKFIEVFEYDGVPHNWYNLKKIITT